MKANLWIWSVIGAVALQSIAPDLAEARRYGGYGSRSVHRVEQGFRRRYRPVLAQRRRYYQPVSYSPVDRTGATPRRVLQGDDRFPIAPEAHIAREPESDVDDRRASSLRNYAKRQPQQAMHRLLGKPTRTDGDDEIYNIKGGSPWQAPRRLVIRYQRSSACNYTCKEAINWHEE